MIHAKQLIRLVPIILLSVAFAAEAPPYDEQADAHRQVAAAILEAAQAHKNIVVVFGANWCPDCRALDAQMHKGELADLIAANYEVVRVDVGRFNKNQDLGAKYQVPLRHGIPALAVLDPKGKLLYAMDQGQFADARHLSYESIREFFGRWAPKR